MECDDIRLTVLDSNKIVICYFNMQAYLLDMEAFFTLGLSSVEKQNLIISFAAASQVFSSDVSSTHPDVFCAIEYPREALLLEETVVDGGRLFGYAEDLFLRRLSLGILQ